MRTYNKKFVALLTCFMLFANYLAFSQNSKMNVLFIAIDDFRPEPH